MKISKSKQELARIISENGGWRDVAEFAWFQGKLKGRQCREVWFGEEGSEPEYVPASGSFHSYWSMVVDKFPAAKFDNWHQTILSSAEYLHLYPAQDADGWIEWGGGNIPVGFGTLVDVKLRGGNVEIGQQFTFSDSWLHHGSSLDIIAYRLHNPEQANPEFCESVTRSIPDPEKIKELASVMGCSEDIEAMISVAKSNEDWIRSLTSRASSHAGSIEQLAADYRNARDFAERKQQEADDAKADADARLKALELAGESLGLLVSPITEKQDPELSITDWCDLQVGDEIKVIGFDGDIVEEQRCNDLLDADSCTVVKQGDYV